MPKVSVIIPVYNSSKYVSEAIASVFAQTYQDFEIIVIDDGSTDNSREIIEDFIEKYPSKINYIYQKNKGIAGARNTGIKNAKGSLIALLDADDKWHPARLEKEIVIIESSPQIGLVHSNLMSISEDGIPLENFKRNKKYLSGYIFKHLFLRSADIGSPTVLFRKDCCMNVGLFDENIVCMGCDDRDMWLRIAQKYRVEYINEILAYHRLHNTNFSNNTQRMFNARLYVINKFYPGISKNNKLKKLALAKVHRDLGDHFLYGLKFKESTREYLKALSFRPFYFWALVNLSKSLLKVNVTKKWKPKELL